jgi:drug/metabolite transporter (DMT)-like permease
MIEIPLLNVAFLLAVLAVIGVLGSGFVSKKKHDLLSRFWIGILAGLLLLPFLFYISGKLLNMRLDIPGFLVIGIVLSAVIYFVQGKKGF